MSAFESVARLNSIFLVVLILVVLTAAVALSIIWLKKSDSTREEDIEVDLPKINLNKEDRL